MPETPAAARRAFGPVLATGLASAALLAVASAKPWFDAPVDDKLLPGVPELQTQADSPAALALSLVVLAGWGALLVTRGRARRLVATVALVAGLGVLAIVVTAPFTLPGQLREQLDLTDVAVTPTPWYVAAAVASVVAVLALLAAWRLVPAWPEMGSRYDAPGGPGAAQDVDVEDPRALWKALDEGSDPTDRDVP